MKFPLLPKISAHERHRENLISYFLLIGSPMVLTFAVIEWLGNRQDEAILDMVVLVIFLVAAVMRRRVENPQRFYQVVMTALGLNFLYVLVTNPGVTPALYWHLALPLPAVILLGVREGMIWIIAMGVSIITALSTPAKSPFVTSEDVVIFATIYLTTGLLSIFSEYVRQQTALMLAAHQTNLETMNQTIMEKALVDPLTETYNRSYLTEVMPGKVSMAVTLSRPLSIIIVDIDQFKEINDTHGHHSGDRVLIEIANLFRHQLRGASDEIVRLGGDEFMIVLPETTLAHAVTLAERLLKSIEEMAIPKLNFKVTCSMGVVQLEEIGVRRTFLPDQAINNLIKRGDNCMYLAKRRGKNLVVSNCEENESEDSRRKTIVRK